MTTHNPGPWSAFAGGGRNDSLITIYDASGCMVASVSRQYQLHQTGRRLGYDEQRRLRNAELIAAAPVMLKAISDYLGEKNITRDGLRFALAAALGEHPPHRQCDCLDCFEYFWPAPHAATPPLMQGVESHD